ncbi:MAG: trypsin-like peptidase domain-containing protein [bacterium]|nr:trypsin-like peptidase domain-containing protein [bacterium]
MKRIIHLLLKLSLLSIYLMINSCSTVSYQEIYPILADGKYDSEFPYKGASNELRQISSTVRRINSSVIYKTYTFDAESKLTLSNLKDIKLRDIAISEGYADQNNSGTGTVVYFNEGKVAILTCAHVVEFPDTIISYFPASDGSLTKFIQVIFIKERQSIYAVGFPEGGEFELIASDKKQDIAIIGKDYKVLSDLRFPVFNYPFGKGKELDWGSFVYIFGYPINNQMITKAIVSNPNKDEFGSFLVDAVVNNGMSGGVVLAIRDGVPNFELVGMIQWVPEEEENILVPKALKDNERYNPIVPYQGEEYVKRFSSIRYGIARVISAERISSFIFENKAKLSNKKYYLDRFWN